MFSKKSLLGNEKKDTTIFQSLHMAGVVFGVSDQLQLSILKATSDVPGLPKEKHITNLLDIIARNEDEFENILINMSSITDWEESKIVSCKVLLCILLILQKGLKSSILKSIDSLNFILVKIRDYWANEDKYLYHFSMFLIQKCNFLTENLEFCTHFNLNTSSSTGLSLPSLDNRPILSIASLLLCIQDNLIVTMQIVTKGSTDETLNASLMPLLEEANSNFIAINKLLEHTIDNNNCSNVTRKVFLEQYSNQYNQLQVICQNMEAKYLFNEEKQIPKFTKPVKLR